MKNLVEVEKGREGINGAPSVGPAYRSILAKDIFPPPDLGLDSCWDIFRLSVEKYPDSQMLGRRKIVDGKAGEYEWQTYKDVYDIVMNLGTSIRSLGIEKGGRCGIYGANCPEWIVSMEACNAHGIYCVPLYDTLGAGAVEFILCHAEVEIAFAEETKVGELLKTLPASTKFLKTIVSFGKVKPEQRETVEKHGLAIYEWNDFLALGGGKHYDLPLKVKDDICTIMYTSGTTGDPKGVMISNRSILSVIAGVKRFFESENEEIGVGDVYLSYLPLAHIFDRVVEDLFICHGASIGFWRGDIKGLVEDMGVLKPTILCAVPRVLDRIYSGLQAKISSGVFLKNLFSIGYKYKRRNIFKGVKQEDAGFVFDKFVFSQIKQVLGGRVRFIFSGAAPLAKHVEEFMRVVTCAHLLQGFGLTETCAVTMLSLPNDISMLGTVGPPVPNIDVRLESVPEMGYDALGTIPCGEICIRGESLFSGYYKRDDLTREVLVDGWFHTGDIGEWQPNGSMKIIDRKKNIFKLSQGEYVAVENLENIYGKLPEIDSIWVYGNSFESFLVAVINPSREAIENWALSNGLSGNFEELCENLEVTKYILGLISSFARVNKLKGFEIIKGIHLDPVLFDMERDLLTPTYKKKRPQLLKYYQDVINGLYQINK
ncbi:hypothetical protein LUZ63_016735 [Rhynchospora breviuscula]|uniref:Long-chain-fatty-acid--CoA ligase n=1 Tax=Rhynchospora breviuscula TaxID=2022672 RepID=A0A9P9ZAF2_9POAL|nr:hypothetical protein LUZ63_016735 [Rhynchospora breviuscula]